MRDPSRARCPSKRVPWVPEALRASSLLLLTEVTGAHSDAADVRHSATPTARTPTRTSPRPAAAPFWARSGRTGPPTGHGSRCAPDSAASAWDLLTATCYEFADRIRIPAARPPAVGSRRPPPGQLQHHRTAKPPAAPGGRSATLCIPGPHDRQHVRPRTHERRRRAAPSAAQGAAEPVPARFASRQSESGADGPRTPRQHRRCRRPCGRLL